MNKQQVRFYAEEIRRAYRSGGEVLKAVTIMEEAANAEPEPLVVMETWMQKGLAGLLASTPSGPTGSIADHPDEVAVTMMLFERAIGPMQKEE